ncbi:MAG: hypothetical protein GX629_06660 [Phycisphaerae bacterium]|nr:hypothetical protein [Phycisphaerae bacterium]
MSGRGKAFTDLNHLRDHLARKRNHGDKKDNELLTELMKNIQSQLMLFEWQDLLLHEQKTLVRQLERSRGVKS